MFGEHATFFFSVSHAQEIPRGKKRTTAPGNPQQESEKSSRTRDAAENQTENWNHKEYHRAGATPGVLLLRRREKYACCLGLDEMSAVRLASRIEKAPRDSSFKSNVNKLQSL